MRKDKLYLIKSFLIPFTVAVKSGATFGLAHSVTEERETDFQFKRFRYYKDIESGYFFLIS